MIVIYYLYNTGVSDPEPKKGSRLSYKLDKLENKGISNF